jgi:hypothetical protein
VILFSSVLILVHLYCYNVVPQTGLFIYLFIAFTFTFSLDYCARWGYTVAFAQVLFLIIIFIRLYLLYGRGDLHRFLQCINCIILEFTLSTASFYPFLLRIMNKFQQVSFLHLHAYVHIFALYSPSYPLSPPPPTHTGVKSSTWAEPVLPS